MLDLEKAFLGYAEYGGYLMLEITGNDIRDLSDSDLRGLIGLLCEAELRAADFPTAGVTWGGHHNAKDGGLDIRVELTAALHGDCFIPRSITGFQVKKPDMPRSAIWLKCERMVS